MKKLIKAFKLTGLIIIIATLLFTIRGIMVYNYRTELLRQMVVGSRADIAESKDFEWRFDKFRDVNQGNMTLKFWKNFDSFYPDKSFLE